MGTDAGNRTPDGMGRIWIALAVGLPPLIALLVPMATVDLAYQVRAGAEIWATGALPATDSWTFTIAGTPWADQQWLAQVLLSAVHRLGGWELLAVLRAGLIAAVAALLVLTALRRGAGERTSAVLALLAFMLASPSLALRPQLFGILAFAALLAVVAGRVHHPRVFLAAPLIVAVWANVHGSFVLAPLLLGWVWLDDVVRRRPSRRALVVLVAGCLATLVTPLGPGVWVYAAGIGANPVIAQTVSEWQRTTPFTVPGALFYLSLAASLVIVWRGRSRLAWPDTLWLAGMAVLAVWAVRGLAWWPAGAVPVLAAALAQPSRESTPGPHTVRVGPRRLLAGVLLVAIVAALPWWRPGDVLTGRQGLLSYAPSGLALALRDRAVPGARVFVPQPWGSWFEWAVPQARYFADARFELFPPAVWADLAVIGSGGEAADAALRRYDVEFVVWPASWPAPGADWEQIYRDEDGAVLRRPAQAIIGSSTNGRSGSE